MFTFFCVALSYVCRGLAMGWSPSMESWQMSKQFTASELIPSWSRPEDRSHESWIWQSHPSDAEVRNVGSLNPCRLLESSRRSNKSDSTATAIAGKRATNCKRRERANSVRLLLEFKFIIVLCLVSRFYKLEKWGLHFFRLTPAAEIASSISAFITLCYNFHR